jgi:GNAT superfamily N-acetyltransferase
VYCQKIDASQTVHLRQAVLWPALTLDEVRLPNDDLGYHIGAFVAPALEPVAVISLFYEEVPDNTLKQASPLFTEARLEGRCTEVRFRKFACSAALQGRGIGSTLLNYAICIARSELRASVLWCDARTTAIDWYRKKGLTTFGGVFSREGIGHIRMRMDLSPVEQERS